MYLYILYLKALDSLSSMLLQIVYFTTVGQINNSEYKEWWFLWAGQQPQTVDPLFYMLED